MRRRALFQAPSSSVGRRADTEEFKKEEGSEPELCCEDFKDDEQSAIELGQFEQQLFASKKTVIDEFTGKERIDYLQEIGLAEELEKLELLERPWQTLEEPFWKQDMKVPSHLRRFREEHSRELYRWSRARRE